MVTRVLVAAVVCVLAAVSLVSISSGSPESGPPVVPGTRSVLFVANNWDGTADIVDPKTFQRLGRFNTVPDLEERLAEINRNPVRLGYFIGIRQLIGEGHDQFADDMFSSHDGRFVYISRPSLADVVGIDLKTNAIVWRFPMEGQRSDHMAISPDGKHLLVSDSTANKVHQLETATGKKVGEFASGDSPHENNYSQDGTKVFHASIGLVYTPADQPVADSTKGERYFQIVDAKTNQILKRLDIGQIAAANGYPDMSSAVRPMAISPDEKTVYMQLSFHHGFVEFDVDSEKVTRVATLPQSDEAKAIPRENYLLDSAHHGLAINPEGTKLCAAGTMSDYAAIVSTKTFEFTIPSRGPKPYWSTNSADGKYCFVSYSGSDEVAVIDYATEKEVTRIPVGDHPQRMRMGIIRNEYVGGLDQVKAIKGPARLHVTGAKIRDGALEARVRITSRATGKIALGYRAGRRVTGFQVAIPESQAKGQRVLRIRRRLPASLARQGGTLDVRFRGSDLVAPERVQIRVDRGKSRLKVTRARMSGGKLRVEGTISRRARGTVSVALSYIGDGSQVRVLGYKARIRNGRWSIDRGVPSQARDGGQLSVAYAGDARRRLRGEQFTRRLGADASAARGG